MSREACVLTWWTSLAAFFDRLIRQQEEVTLLHTTLFFSLLKTAVAFSLSGLLVGLPESALGVVCEWIFFRGLEVSEISVKKH